MKNMDDRKFAVCGIVEINGAVLLVRHTYGNAKDRILLPGGFVQEREMPADAIAREIYEETGITAQAKSVLAVQFKPAEWCVVFVMDYIAGAARSDGYENSEVLLLPAAEAVKHTDITNMSRVILSAYLETTQLPLPKSDYVPKSAQAGEYGLFIVK